jgi:hypothetical protein
MIIFSFSDHTIRQILAGKSNTGRIVKFRLLSGSYFIFEKINNKRKNVEHYYIKFQKLLEAYI